MLLVTICSVQGVKHTSLETADSSRASSRTEDMGRPTNPGGIA